MGKKADHGKSLKDGKSLKGRMDINYLLSILQFLCWTQTKSIITVLLSLGFVIPEPQRKTKIYSKLWQRNTKSRTNGPRKFVTCCTVGGSSNF